MKPWRTNEYYTSLWNWEKNVRKDIHFPEEIKLHDVTLRDGEQQAGVVLTPEQKIDLACRMDEMGIHRIEAGMPAVSEEDARAIREIVKKSKRAEIFGFARCMMEDVKRAADCGVKGIVIEIPSNEEMIKSAYGWSLEKAIDLSIKASLAAKEAGLYTVFFPIDMSRANMDWVLQLIGKVAADGHMDALAIVDTLGGLHPHTIPYLVEAVKSKINKPLELHFHDDFGLSVANSLMGLAAGAEVCHTTISAIGERAGNCSYEDLAMALYTMYGVDLGIDYTQIYRLSKVLQEYTGIKVRGNRGVIGDDIFKIESGIVSDWYLHCKEIESLLVSPYLAEVTGHPSTEIVLGKHSGKANIKMRLDEIGKTLNDDEMKALVADVKIRAYQKHGLLNDTDFAELLQKYE